MDTPIRTRAALSAGGATLAVGTVLMVLLSACSGGNSSAVQQIAPASTHTTSPTATTTPTASPTPTATASSTPIPPATTTPIPSAAPPATFGPPPTLAAPFGFPPYPGTQPYAMGGPAMAPPGAVAEPPADTPPGQPVRYRMYTCTNYQAKEGAPAAYHCKPEVDPRAEQQRYYGYYGGQSGTPHTPYAQPYAPQPYGMQPYGTQPYTYSTPAPGSVVFNTCTDARNAGYSTIPRGSAGYSTTLDRDNDGIACETGE